MMTRLWQYNVTRTRASSSSGGSVQRLLCCVLL
jgi:hypothetical protein